MKNITKKKKLNNVKFKAEVYIQLTPINQQNKYENNIY